MAQLCPELMTLAHARSQMSVDVNHISQDTLVSQFKPSRSLNLIGPFDRCVIIFLDPKTGHSWCLEECPKPECGDNEQWNDCGSCEETKCCQGDDCGTSTGACTTVCQPRCECAEGNCLNHCISYVVLPIVKSLKLCLNHFQDMLETRTTFVLFQKLASVSLYAFKYGNITLKQNLKHSNIYNII